MPITEHAVPLGAFATSRDEAAFRALVERYLPLVHAAAMRHTRGNDALAQEIAQDVFIALATKAEALRGRPTLAPWLFTTTRLAALHRLRSEQRRLERNHKVYTMKAASGDSETVDWTQARPLIDGLLAKLKPREQEALFLRFFEGFTFAEIGARLSIDEDGARQSCKRALEKLRSLLSRRGVCSSSAVLAEVLTTQFASAAPIGLASVVANAALAPAASAPASLAAASVIFTAMNVSKVALCSLVLVSIGGIGGTLYNSRDTRHAEAEMTTLRRERAALLTQVDQLNQQLLLQPGHSSSTGTSMTPTPSDKESAAKRVSRPGDAGNTGSTSAGRPASVASLMDQIDHVLAHPELRPAFVQQIVQQLWGEDRRFFSMAGVSLEQEEAIKREAAAYAGTLLDARAGRIGGEDFSALFTAADEHSLAQVRRILGEDTFQRLKQYKAQSAENRAVDLLATRLYFTDTPLTGRHAALLSDILAQNRFSTDHVSRQIIGGRIVSSAEYSTFRSSGTGPRMALITDAAIARALGVLPAATVAALQNLQASQSADIRLSRPGVPVK